ncbi:neuroglobin-1-like [Aphis craccivora]|uniref:Neuroglobin-1-like n=1 Tax=Aphis craccivora TaxID=307492 RepID=A0A6G0YM59_APHCR|nr:neuroglobin-1-like [Aphis craccivora]
MDVNMQFTPYRNILTDLSKSYIIKGSDHEFLLILSLFETHPDVQQSFMPFKGVDLEDLKHSRQLRDHALRKVHKHKIIYQFIIIRQKIINYLNSTQTEHVQVSGFCLHTMRQVTTIHKTELCGNIFLPSNVFRQSSATTMSFCCILRFIALSNNKNKFPYRLCIGIKLLRTRDDILIEKTQHSLN